MFSRKKNLLPPKKSMVMNYKFFKQKFREIAQLGLGVIIVIQAVLFYQIYIDHVQQCAIHAETLKYSKTLKMVESKVVDLAK